MSHLDVMVKLHVYLFQTKIKIRKIPSSAIMLAHDPKSSTFYRHATGFFCSMGADWSKQKAEQEKERVEMPQILNIYTRYQIMCVFFKGFIFDIMLCRWVNWTHYVNLTFCLVRWIWIGPKFNLSQLESTRSFLQKK